MRQGRPITMASRTAILIDIIEAVGLVALVVGGLLALAVSIVPAAEPPTEATEVAPAAPASDNSETAAPAAAALGSETATLALVDSFAVTADTSLVFVLRIGSRLYPEWSEERRVRLHERFVIGDTENAAVVTTLLPDFRIADGGPRSVSPSLANPAVRVYVYRGEAATDSAWAFLNFPPHFSPQSFFTFQLKEVVGYRAPHAAGAPAPEGAAAEPATAKQPEGE